MGLAIDEFSGQSLSYCFDYVEQRSDTSLPSDRVSVFRERTYKAFKEDLRAIPGIENLLKLLDCPVCVASNAPREKIELNLGILKLSHFFNDNFFSAYDVQRWKPEPHLFLHAAQIMGFEAHECAVIEDSVAGVQAAVAGGFDVFGYASKRTAKKLEIAGANVFYDMNTLFELLR